MKIKHLNDLNIFTINIKSYELLFNFIYLYLSVKNCKFMINWEINF